MKKIVAMAIAVVFASSPAWSQVLSVGTNPSGTVSYSVAAAVSKVVSENTKLRMRVAPQGGPVVTIPLLNKKEFEFSTGVSVVSFFAAKGKAMFKKSGPQKNMRVLGAMLPTPLAMMTSRKSGIKTLADLKGKRIGSGFPKQKIVGVFTNAYLKSVGIAKTDYTAILEPNGSRGVQDLMAGRVDATLFTVFSGLAQQADAKTGGIRWLPLPASPEGQAIARKGVPGTIITTLQPGQGAGVNTPITILSTPMVVMTHVGVSNDIVYQIAKLLHTNKAKLQAAFKGFKNFNTKDMAVNFGAPYHAGAEKYYREAGIWPSK
jgi:TRAP transporter TAXI family solute receptor